MTPRGDSIRSTPAWRRYLRFWGHDAARDLDDELRFHVDARYDEFIAAGMSPTDARDAVAQRFGNMSDVQARCAAIDSQWERERTMADLARTIVADIRYAVRQLRRNSALNVAAILCFALGIGANTAMFSVVDALLLRPLPFPHADRLVLVGEALPRVGKENFGVISAPEYEDYRRLDGHAFSASAIFEPESHALAGDGEPERVVGLRASSSIFTVLDIAAERGRVLAPADDSVAAPDVVVISDALWRRRYGAAPSIVGRSIDVDDLPMTIVGVTPPRFRFPIAGVGGEPADVILPFRISADIERQRANSYSTYFIARLAPGISVTDAQHAVAGIASQLPSLHPDAYSGNWITLADAFPLHDRSVSDVRRPLIVLVAAVCFVLLIACINVSSLLLARATTRGRELSVRRALGASHSRLLQQFLAESLVLVAIGTVAGVALATWSVRLIAAHAPAALLQGYDVSVDGRVLGVTGAVVVITALVFSLVPALQRSDGTLGGALRDAGRGAVSEGARHQRGRRGLVVMQMALALTLATGAGLMAKSFVRALGVNPGFDPDRVLTFRVEPAPARYPTAQSETELEQRLLGQVRALPGVRSAAATSHLPFTGPSRIAFAVEGATLSKLPIASLEFVTPNYFETLHIPLRGGRYLGEVDRAQSLPSAMINQTLADEYFPGVSAVGRRIKWGSPASPAPWATVVGVTADVRSDGVDRPTQPAIYFPLSQLDTSDARNMTRSRVFVVRTEGDPRMLENAVRAIVRAADPTLPIVALQPMTDVLSTSTAGRRFNTVLLGAFSVIALALASFGLYGLMAYAVSQRTREIGIRIAVGAAPAAVLRLILAQGARLGALGVAVGLLGAILFARAMRTLLFDVSPFDVPTFVGAAALLLSVAALASYLPARRAARVDPQEAVRAD
ncbi:MAG TPA: ABC transporter permease [Gemmatimonadaceae bacterium]